MVEVLFLVPGPIPPYPTCVLETAQIPFLQLEVCEGLCTSGQSGQDAGERCLGIGRPSQLGFL